MLVREGGKGGPSSGSSLVSDYFFFLDEGLWARVLPAADFDALLVLPSRRTFDAALAALFEVTLLGAFVWDKALPAAVLDLRPVNLLRSVFDALLAAFGLVTFDFAIFLFSYFFLGFKRRATKNKNN